MKTTLLLLSILFSISCFSQDNITLKNKKQFTVVVTRITNDSVFWNDKKAEKGIALTEIKKFESYDDLKKYYINNGDTTKKISYSQYCMDKYRSTSAAGKVTMMIGSGVTIYSLATLMNLSNPKEGEEIDRDKVKSAYVVGIAGSVVTILGILFDASANSHLKNIYSAPEYEIGIGYRFKF